MILATSVTARGKLIFFKWGFVLTMANPCISSHFFLASLAVLTMPSRLQKDLPNPF